ncbi:DUF2953 domain-containing protein [Aliibacillus thermotolerans]|uniref:DUF2953 domain-containing protein n=1 Tax=Aliibacillus thermotolerans TaxID=1834418 RepID=A0ABW0U8M1_9BACI|nr:DUF2953 domain-containing protein [Aliibacillus thermotolerans]MDA3129804.1 DUF2953 domain-containing protein [Aliibacillus thermotolerans]
MYWMIGTVILLLIAIWFAPIDISYDMKKKKKRYDIQLKITVWYVIRKKIAIPWIRLDEETPSLIIHERSEGIFGQPNEKDVTETPKEMKAQIQTFHMWVKHIQSFRPVVKNFLRKITVKHWKWSSSLGTGDAALTGMMAGGLWSVKYMANAVLATFLRMDTSPDFSIQPFFQKKIFDFHLSCMVSFRLGHAVIAGYKLWRQLRGNVWQLWKQTKWNQKISKEASS